MISSERASAAALPSTSRQMLAAYRARRYRGLHAAIRRSSRSFTRSLEPFSFRSNRNRALDSSFDAFPRREPVSTSPENALIIEPPDVGQDRDDLAVAEHFA